VWYADALDPRAPAACPDRSRRSTPASQVGSVLGAVGTLMGAVADLSGEHEAAALRSLAGDLLYLGDEGKRCAAEERLAGALARAAAEDRPIIVVAHSFGSLVAYHHLQTRDTAGAVTVERLITVGSLIGRPELRDLLLGQDGRRAALPPGVGSWVNVRDPEDPFAAPLHSVRADSAQAERIRDVRTERAGARDPHDAARYLIDPATARAVRESWCSASRSTPASPGPCPR
jgi:pimeloyl-ACP methyl ester carboxylesterase